MHPPPMHAPLTGPYLGFTRGEALAAGHTADAIRHRLETGMWRRLRRGHYVEQSSWDALAAHPSRQVALSVAAAQRCLNVHTWAAGLTAATLHGADVLTAPAMLRFVTDDNAGRRRGPGYAVVRALLPAHHRCMMEGLPLTSPARTLVDVARTVAPREAIVVADSLMRQTPLHHADVSRVLADMRRAPGIDRAVRIAAFADGRAESPLESVGRLSMAGQGLHPEPQVWIYDGRGRRGRVDFLFRDRWTIVETDGLVKYADSRDLKEEKLRQEWLEQLGFVVVRATWHELDNQPLATAARVREGFAVADARASQRRRDTWFISTALFG